jgi:hypothetical protein
LFTFRTELKKVIISNAKQLYNIFPRSGATHEDSVQKRVTEAASKLIKSGDYLRLPDSSEVGDDCGAATIVLIFLGQVHELRIAGS